MEGVGFAPLPGFLPDFFTPVCRIKEISVIKYKNLDAIREPWNEP